MSKKTLEINYNEVDKSIIPLIKLMNEKGLITEYSCSGLHKDHKGRRQELISGYVAFILKDLKIESKLEKIAGSCHMGFEKSNCRTKCYYDFSEKEYHLTKESYVLHTHTFRNDIPEIVNCNDKRKITKKFLDGLVEYKWNLLYERIKKL